MITSDASPESERRARVRQLANITAALYDDAKLDVKIEVGDSIATSLFGGVPPAEGGRLENLITVSGLKAAELIALGIANDSSIERVRGFRTLCDEIVAASNDSLMRQHRPQVRVTPGPTAGARGFGQ